MTVCHYTIAELSKEFGLTVRTLRFWEERKLIRPEPRGSKSATRLYSATERDRIRVIVMLGDAGFTLTEIGNLIILPKAAQRDRIASRLPELWIAAVDAHQRQTRALDRVELEFAKEPIT